MFAKMTSTIGFHNNLGLSQEDAVSFDLSSAQLKAASFSPQTGLHLRSKKVQHSVIVASHCISIHVNLFKQGMRPRVSWLRGQSQSWGQDIADVYAKCSHHLVDGHFVTACSNAAMEDFMFHLHDTGPIALVSDGMLTWL